MWESETLFNNWRILDLWKGKVGITCCWSCVAWAWRSLCLSTISFALASKSWGVLASIPSSAILILRRATLSSISTLICFSSCAALEVSFRFLSWIKNTIGLSEINKTRLTYWYIFTPWTISMNCVIFEIKRTNRDIFQKWVNTIFRCYNIYKMVWLSQS